MPLVLATRVFQPRELGPTQLTAAGIAMALRASAPLEEPCVDGFEQHPLGYPEAAETVANLAVEAAAARASMAHHVLGMPAVAAARRRGSSRGSSLQSSPQSSPRSSVHDEAD